MVNADRTTELKDMIFRALAVWLVIALAEVAQGYLRVRHLNRRVGDKRARQIGVLTGSVLILALTWITFPWIGIRTAAEAQLVGGFWLALMLAFDVGFGRWVFHAPWERILGEFDLRRGRLLALGMLVVLLAPWLVLRLR